MSAVATLTHKTDTNDVLALSLEERSDILADEAGSISSLFTEWQESTTQANAAQVAAGARLRIVQSLSSVLFTDDEGEELSKRGVSQAFAAWWKGEGLNKDFVSRAIRAAELGDLVGQDVAAEFNAEMVKKILPVAFEQTASGKLRKEEVRAANTAKVLRKAEELADTDGREIAGRDIVNAREMLNLAPAVERNTESVVKVRAVVRAATMGENAVLDFSRVTNEDMAALRAFMVTAENGWTARLEEMAADEASKDAESK